MEIKKIPVLIDCDTGIDDILSFVLAFSSNKLDIKGITTVAGNQKLEYTTYNTLNALELMQRFDIPLAKGADKPLERDLKDAGYIHGKSGLGEYVFAKETNMKPVELEAMDFLYEKLNMSKEKVIIIALAPLTNIAKLLMKYPEVKNKIEKIVFMGGSIRTGNPTPVSTFNVLVDPEAARYVMKVGVEFEMCPLDTTRFAYLTDDEIEKINDIKNPVAEMAYQVCDFYNRTTKVSNNGTKRFKGLCIHDLATVMAVTNPEIFTSKKYYGDVETKGELTTGFTMIDYEDILKKEDNEKNIKYLESIDREKFVEIFFEALNQYN